MLNMCTCMWTVKKFLGYRSSETLEDFFFNLKGKFYFQTFKCVKVKLVTNWVFLFTLISF